MERVWNFMRFQGVWNNKLRGEIMGNNWIDLYNGTAIYESVVSNITTGFDYLIEEIELEYANNNGVVDIEMRVSFDGGFSWEDWVSIINLHKTPFDGNEIPLTNASFQYRVTMNMNAQNAVSPSFSSIKMNLNG